MFLLFFFQDTQHLFFPSSYIPFLTRLTVTPASSLAPSLARVLDNQPFIKQASDSQCPIRYSKELAAANVRQPEPDAQDKHRRLSTAERSRTDGAFCPIVRDLRLAEGGEYPKRKLYEQTGSCGSIN